MQNKWREALQEYLKQDPKLYHLFGDRIGFVRIPKNMIADGDAYIIFNQLAQKRDEYANENFDQGIDMVSIIIDMVVPYDKIAEGIEMRGYVRSLLGKFSGRLNQHWAGEISFTSFAEISHDADTDNVLLGSLYLLKQGYDYTNNGSDHQ